jgi:hypothetical protein
LVWISISTPSRNANPDPWPQRVSGSLLRLDTCSDITCVYTVALGERDFESSSLFL